MCNPNKISETLIEVGLLLRDELETGSIVTSGKGLRANFENVRIVDLDKWNRVVDTLCKGEMPQRSSKNKERK